MLGPLPAEPSVFTPVHSAAMPGSCDDVVADATFKPSITVTLSFNGSMLESFAFANTEESNYSMTAKAMLRTLGLPVGECRLPLPPIPAGVEDRCREVYARLTG